MSFYTFDEPMTLADLRATFYFHKSGHTQPKLSRSTWAIFTAWDVISVSSASSRCCASDHWPRAPFTSSRYARPNFATLQSTFSCLADQYNKHPVAHFRSRRLFSSISMNSHIESEHNDNCTRMMILNISYIRWIISSDVLSRNLD